MKGMFFLLEKRQFKNFISYYKWHLIFFLIILICIIFILTSVTRNIDPDVIIGYIATPYVKLEDFDNNKANFEHLLHDANNDGKKNAKLIDYTIDKQSDINELFVDMIDSKSYHIYILPKEAFEAYKDKSAFADIEISGVNVESLSDENGRIYAYTIEGNTYAESLGFINTDNLFIAAANFREEELSTGEKNGINITREIIKRRRD